MFIVPEGGNSAVGSDESEQLEHFSVSEKCLCVSLFQIRNDFDLLNQRR